ncbi:hypothetical protein T09_1967 [Trichinella sp. T9]|nr:hypothetical protein T09_1967 [Trichinella sp. T9]
MLHSKAEELGVQLEPAKFVCDFETGLILAIQGNFLNYCFVTLTLSDVCVGVSVVCCVARPFNLLVSCVFNCVLVNK